MQLQLLMDITYGIRDLAALHPIRIENALANDHFHVLLTQTDPAREDLLLIMPRSLDRHSPVQILLLQKSVI